MIAAIAIPNLFNAIDRGKQSRTMADLRSIGTACESYSMDTGSYPGPTEEWVGLEEIASSLEPVYIRELPRTDGWGHALLYWSDGRSYRIVSPGKDGETMRDWRGEIEPGATTHFAADIVFGDARFLAWPEGTQQ
jgi:general secretion pathway protein G